MVLVSDPETEKEASVEDLRERFGLPPAEAAFALEIIEGDGRQATARPARNHRRHGAQPPVEDFRQDRRQAPG